jgi:sulfatase maturation enzyme AslB (radical SAM superfamily)
MLIKNKTDWLYNEFMIKPSLSLHINDRCFNECSCCIYDCKPTNKGKLDKELAMKCINEVPKGTTIVFHGGEPMLDFEYCREL